METKILEPVRKWLPLPYNCFLHTSFSSLFVGVHSTVVLGPSACSVHG